MHMAISVVLIFSTVMAHRQEPLVNVYDDKYDVLCVYTDLSICKCMGCFTVVIF